MNYTALKNVIAQVIRENGNQEITGTSLQNVLNLMVNTISDGYLFVGIATPTMNPTNVDNRCWIAVQEGTYANFGGAVVAKGQIAILKNNGTNWQNESAAIELPIDNVPTADSNKLVKSGGVKSAIDYAYNNSVGVRVQSFSNAQKAQARTNIGAANQSDLNSTNQEVAKKANQSDLNSTNQEVAKKANQSDLNSTNQEVNALKRKHVNTFNYVGTNLVLPVDGAYSYYYNERETEYPDENRKINILRFAFPIDDEDGHIEEQSNDYSYFYLWYDGLFQRIYIWESDGEYYDTYHEDGNRGSNVFINAQSQSLPTCVIRALNIGNVPTSGNPNFSDTQKAQARNNIGAYSKPNDGIPVSDINLTNLPEIGIGYGICTTDTYEASKVVSIPNFLLLQDAIINVLFTTPINSSNSTLNVNNTGAKPIRALDSALPSGVIKAQSIVTFVYNNNAWNIINVFTPDASFDPDELVVDMGLPSGVKWAARDIDLTKPSGFCDTPFTYMKSFFSWGNIDGHNPISNSAFDYNWGGVNSQAPYYEGQPYGETKGNELTANIAVGEEYDAARANLGTPWRMPTSEEYVELFANIRYINADGTEVDTTKTDKRVTVNGILGLYIESTINGARLFFSCSGNGNGRSWKYRVAGGHYWSSTWMISRYARSLNFNSGGVNPRNDGHRCYGFAVRPVQ